MNAILALSRCGLGRSPIFPTCALGLTTVARAESISVQAHLRRANQVQSTGVLLVRSQSSKARKKPPATTPVLRSNAPPTPVAKAPGPRKAIGHTYPYILNVHYAGQFASLFMGFSRVLTAFLAIYGTLWSATYLFDSTLSHKWLYIPGIAIGAAIPFLYMALATGPFVHKVNVFLPKEARGSREALFKFAANPPVGTEIQIMRMGFVPWPMRQTMSFSRLRRLRPKRGRLANMSYVLKDKRTKLFIKKDQKKNLSVVPGVWDLMWDRIPFEDPWSSKRA